MTKTAKNKQTAKRVSKHRDKKRDATVAKAKRKSRLTAKESDAAKWLLRYMPGAFPLPFGDAHHRIVEAVTYAIDNGSNVAIAAPRGTGKSTLVNGLVLWALLTGRTAFPVVLPWDDKARKRALRFWSQELCFNELIHKDYPEHTDILVRSRGIAQKLAALTQDGKATGARLGLNEGLIVLPNSLGAIGSATINGNPRGLNYATIDGKIIRPTFAIIDDPQDRETAKSATRVADAVDVVQGDIAGMAGPDQRMAMVMPCTVIERNDVAENFLSHPDWQSIRVSQILEWPSGWDKTDSETRKLWKEWNYIRQESESKRDGGKAAIKFYKANKAAMTLGMSVSWDHRYDKRRGQPDAMYAAMYDYFVMGHEAFMSERQNDPVKKSVTLYTLTPKHIMDRTDKRNAGIVPDWAKTVLAATDVNPSYALSTAIAAFGDDQRCAVIWYGLRKMEADKAMSDGQIKAYVHQALSEHGRHLAQLPCRPNFWTVDGGGSPQNTAIDFCANSARICGLPSVTSFGRGSTNYRPTGGKGRKVVVREESHLVRERHDRQWIVWNAHYWMEQAQRGWIAEFGAPGSCTLPEGNHRDFAEQICREQLQGKAEIGGKMVYQWHRAPGPHDYADVMAMLYMLAASYAQIGTGGRAAPVTKQKRHKPKVSVVQL